MKSKEKINILKFERRLYVCRIAFRRFPRSNDFTKNDLKIVFIFHFPLPYYVRVAVQCNRMQLKSEKQNVTSTTQLGLSNTTPFPKTGLPTHG